MRGCDSRKQVRRERGNAALARSVGADKSDLANFRIFFHQAFLSFLAARASYAPTEPDLGTPRLQLG